ncbi:MAG: hypothetical protein U0K68_10195 [Agathobacter sp.]|nr:hypothetical protein [Agathobacter sp.]
MIQQMLTTGTKPFILFDSLRFKDYDEDSSYQNKIPESREWWEPV